MKIFLKILNITMLPVTLILALMLFISGQSPALSPVYSSTLALVGMAFPIWVLLNVMLLIYWAIQLKFRGLIPLFALLFHFQPIGYYLQFHSTEEISDSTAISVISYNANLFGFNKGAWELDSVMAIINQNKPEVVMMQEAFQPNGTLKKLAKDMAQNIGLPYTAVYPLDSKKNYGMIVWSKYKIKRWDKIYFPHETGNMAMFADIIIPNQAEPLRIYNIHLQSIRFDKTDYQTMEEVNNDKSFDKLKTENIINRIRIAYEKRAPQVDVLKKELQAHTQPKIVAGDFNDVPVSYTYYQLIDGLEDAFVSKGKGLETTYKGPFPSFRIDYQLFSSPLKCLNYKSFKDVPSDHKMIQATYTY